MGQRQGRSTIVDFGGIQAAISNQPLERVEKKQLWKRAGRKLKVPQTSRPSTSIRPEPTKIPDIASTEDTSGELVTMIANTLLLNGGLKGDYRVCNSITVR